jgi:hypothetical protein
VVQELARRPAVLDGHLRQQQAAAPAARDDETMTADLE